MERVAQDVWLLVCTGLVLFMQPGFLCLEAGSVRRRNAVNVAMKNFVVELVSSIAFFAIGYSLMFGDSLGGWIATPRPLLGGVQDRELFQFLFQAVFCGTAATIVSGAVAERLRFLPFVLESALLCALLYPLFGHWVWGGGWLAQLGYKDFAGSSVVHLMGAGVALAGVLVLGPRTGRFAPDGTPREIPASDLVLASLGTFILLFGWIGFNGGSAPFGDQTARIVTNTLIAGCFGGVACLFSSWALRGVSDIGLILNGTLGGLVAITACADVVPLQASPAIGLLAGLAVHGATSLLLKLRLDDAVGALPVHGACGILGILATPLFASPGALAAHLQATGTDLTRASWLAVQAAGVVVCLVVSVAGGWILWKLVSLVTRLRVGADGEAVGMNFSEHRLPDPVAEILQALRGVGLAEVDLDRVRGTEFEPVALAVNRLVSDLRARDQGLARNRDLLQNAGIRIADAARQARGGQDRTAAALDDVERKLEHLAGFAREGGGGAALAVAGDMADQLRRVLVAVHDDQRGLGDLWIKVDEAARGLSEAVTRMEVPRG